MILGVDTGTATCGWARFDPDARRFAGLGALELGRAEGAKKTDDHGDRIAAVAELLAEVAIGCDLVIVERMSFPPGGTVPIALGFGAVIGIARTISPRPRVFTVSPQAWQRAVAPKSGRRVNYGDVERHVDAYIRREPASAIAFDSLLPRIRPHARDACAISLMGAFRLRDCREVGRRDRHRTAQNGAPD